MRSARASSLTGRSRPFSRTRIRRRCGSAIALKASDVVAARAMKAIYVHIGICQGPRWASNLRHDAPVVRAIGGALRVDRRDDGRVIDPEAGTHRGLTQGD